MDFTNGIFLHFHVQVFVLVDLLKIFHEFFDNRVEFHFFCFVELTVLDTGKEQQGFVQFHDTSQIPVDVLDFFQLPFRAIRSFCQ